MGKRRSFEHYLKKILKATVYIREQVMTSSDKRLTALQRSCSFCDLYIADYFNVLTQLDSFLINNQFISDHFHIDGKKEYVWFKADV